VPATVRLASMLVLVAACGDDLAPPIPEDVVDPCAAAGYWPHGVRSATLPIEVRFPDDVTDARARDVLALLEDDWEIEHGVLGFREPIAVPGCGDDDDALDVFLWPGTDEAYVEGLVPIDSTAHDDWATIIVIDPDGLYGGDELATTLAHELNHASQAADDWYEPIAVFEASATYVELAVVGDEDVRAVTFADFQAQPGWAFDHDDGYETWSMYGGALYLQVLAAIADDEAVVGAIWEGMRNTGPANEPDWADAVAAVVAPRTLEDTFLELAIWRWYVGAHDDGAHLDDAAAIPEPAIAGAASPGVTRVPLGTIDPLGMAYVTLTGVGTATISVEGLGDELAARLLVLPGVAGDADELTTTVTLDGTPRTLAIVVVPTVPYDPETAPAPAALTLALTWS